MIPENVNVTVPQMLSLLRAAKETTACFAAWSGGLSSDNTQIIALYFQWVEAAEMATSLIAENADPAAKREMAEKLISLMSIPIQGMIKAMQAFSVEKEVVLPPIVNIPEEVFAYKKWGLDYINQCLALFKDAKK